MKERGWIEPIVERVVGQVLERHAAQLRTEITRRVMEEIAAAPAPAESSSAERSPREAAAGPADLARAVSEIQLGTSQKEILRALLDASARYAARVALFVVKGSHATGWQARGFANNDAVKDFALDENAPAIRRAISRVNSGSAFAGAPVADLDARFLDEFGTPASGEARIFPLILKDKIAALVYADSGTNGSGSLDSGSLELLVLSTSAWLEVNSLRKQAQKEPMAAHADSQAVTAEDVPAWPVPSQAAPAFNDPFASHVPSFAPGRAMAAAASAGDVAARFVPAPVADVAPHESQSAIAAWPSELPSEVQSEAQSEVQSEMHSQVQSEVQSVVAIEPAFDAPLAIGSAETSAAFDAVPVSASAPVPAPAAMSTEDQDVHRKAQRFARLLVDEIKLYNQAKVAEGRQNRNLYDRLKEVIEKSRNTYQKRYGTTVAAPAKYFEHEIIRSLAEDDLTLMGANFR